MNERMNERMNGWMNGYVDDSISNRANEWSNKWVHWQVDKWMGQQANVRKNEWMIELVTVLMNVFMYDWLKNSHGLKFIWLDTSKRLILPTDLHFIGV